MSVILKLANQSYTLVDLVNSSLEAPSHSCHYNFGTTPNIRSTMRRTSGAIPMDRLFGLIMTGFDSILQQGVHRYMEGVMVH